MRRNTFMSAALATAAFAAAMPAFADPEPRLWCSDTLVRGTYAIQLQGSRPLAGGVTEVVIGVAVRQYDGEGNVTQVGNIKGSITGYVPNQVGTGTYRVNDDCTVDIEFHPAPGVVVIEKAVIVDEGRELRTIAVNGGAMVTAVHSRI